MPAAAESSRPDSGVILEGARREAGMVKQHQDYQILLEALRF